MSEALRGPWYAVLSDNYGDLRESVDDFDEGDHIEIAVVRGSAAPTGDRRPGSYYGIDVLYELDNMDLADDDDEEIAGRWEQAQAVAGALIALADDGSPVVSAASGIGAEPADSPHDRGEQ